MSRLHEPCGYLHAPSSPMTKRKSPSKFGAATSEPKPNCMLAFISGSTSGLEMRSAQQSGFLAPAEDEKGAAALTLAALQVDKAAAHVADRPELGGCVLAREVPVRRDRGLVEAVAQRRVERGPGVLAAGRVRAERRRRDAEAGGERAGARRRLGSAVRAAQDRRVGVRDAAQQLRRRAVLRVMVRQLGRRDSAHKAEEAEHRPLLLSEHLLLLSEQPLDLGKRRRTQGVTSRQPSRQPMRWIPALCV